MARPKNVKTALARIVIVGIVAGALAILLPNLRSAVFRDLRSILTFWVEWLVALFVLVIGVGMYFLRKQFQDLYGVIEIAIGFGLAFNTTWKVKGEIFKREFFTDDPQRLLAWLSLIASVYIVVRGIDNLSQGWATQPRIDS